MPHRCKPTLFLVGIIRQGHLTHRVYITASKDLDYIERMKAEALTGRFGDYSDLKIEME